MNTKIPTDELFIGLLLSLTQSAYISLGKVPDPMSGKIERNLDQASQTIDLLAALQEKTKGNLKDEEKQFLEHSLSELRLNYVDELKKPAETDEKETAKKTETVSGESEKKPDDESDEKKK